MTKPYIPHPRSLAALVVNELADRPRVMTSGEISRMFGVPSASVGASLKAAVQRGGLMLRLVGVGARPRSEYYPPGFTPPDAVDEPAQPRTKAQPLEVVMYDDGQIHVRGHKIGAAADDEGLAVFTAKQMAYLVARVCTPMIEVTP